MVGLAARHPFANLILRLYCSCHPFLFAFIHPSFCFPADAPIFASLAYLTHLFFFDLHYLIGLRHASHDISAPVTMYHRERKIENVLKFVMQSKLNAQCSLACWAGPCHMPTGTGGPLQLPICSSDLSQVTAQDAKRSSTCGSDDSAGIAQVCGACYSGTLNLIESLCKLFRLQ